jgi:hypothetical protein
VSKTPEADAGLTKGHVLTSVLKRLAYSVRTQDERVDVANTFLQEIETMHMMSVQIRSPTPADSQTFFFETLRKFVNLLRRFLKS